MSHSQPTVTVVLQTTYMSIFERVIGDISIEIYHFIFINCQEVDGVAVELEVRRLTINNEEVF